VTAYLPAKLDLPEHFNKVLVTGGAGFIGQHLVELLLASGRSVTVVDNFSSSSPQSLLPFQDISSFRCIEADIRDRDAVEQAIRGHDLVWHLAANTDIIGGHAKPGRDLEDGVVGTFRVLEAMRATGVTDILFASSGAVYGSLCSDETVSESAGPLTPVSIYGAAKIAAEAMISAFCHTYGLRARVFRFGNVIGSRMTHGVIFDFLNRLSEDPSRLLIRGDGRQEKNYFLVEECLDGMAWAARNIPIPNGGGIEVLNLGTSSVTRVTDLAAIIVDELGLTDVKITIEGTALAWPGDQPRVHFSVDRIARLGWQTRLTSDQSVRVAVRRMLGTLGTFETSGVV
jgi:UDP-glucose 4-epimerase